MAMEFSRNFGSIKAESAAMRPLFWFLCLLSLIPLAVLLPMAPTSLGVAVVAAWIALIWIAISFVRDQFHYVALGWVTIYPYCYYFFSYPAERSIFTIDRALIILMVLEMLVSSKRASRPQLALDVRVSAYIWVLYLLVCFVSLVSHPTSDVLPSYRFLVDGMLMPALIGLYAMRYFPLLADFKRLHLSACLLAIGLFVTGLIELTTGIDLFPWNGSVPMFTDTHVRRADGPFEQQIVLSVVAILAFFFIVYLRRLMPHKVARARLLLHTTGCVASLGAALLPLNRGLVFALVPVAVIDSFSQHGLVARKIWGALFAAILFTTVAAKVLDPRLYDDRVSDPSNVYQRLAQHHETLRVVRDYPLFGVGFGLYHEVTSRDPRYMARWNGIESMNVPHNALMTVLSEEGIVGLALYVAAQLFLIRAMWKIRRAHPPGWLAFLYCILVYGLIGLDYATVYFSDINLFYLFILGVIYQMQSRMAAEQKPFIAAEGLA